MRQFPQFITLIQQTIQDSTDFINWLDSEPWKNDVKIYGSVNKVEGLASLPIEGAEISCRGVTKTTGKDGNFSFMVSIDCTSDDSLPENSWYGLHNCAVIAEKDDDAKETAIPYVFSGGEIYKVFVFTDEDNTLKNKENTLFQRFCYIFEQFFNIFSFKNRQLYIIIS